VRVNSKRTAVVLGLVALVTGASASVTGRGTATAETPASGTTARIDGLHPSLTTAKPVRTARIRGWLHTDGTRIVDAAGRIVRFRGVDVSGMGHGWGAVTPDAGMHGCPSWTPPPPAEVDDVARSGFNVVRVSFSWSNLEPSAPVGGLGSGRHRYNRPYVAALENTVRDFTRRGVAVVLEMAQSTWSPAFHTVGRNHSKCGVGMPGWLYGVPFSALPDASSGSFTISQARRSFYSNLHGVQRAYAAAWAFVAGRFARNHLVVGADMMNEPFTLGAFPSSELRLDHLYDSVGRAIRRANPHLLLAFQDSQFHGAGSLVLRRPPDLPNVVYTYHLYTPVWAPGGLAMTRVYLRRAHAWNVPLWISEFDAFGYASPSGTRVRWSKQLAGMLRFCRLHGIGWTEFAYASKWMLDPATGRLRAGLLGVLRAF